MDPLEFLQNYNAEKKFPPLDDDTDYYELLCAGKHVHTEVVERRRWWNETKTVVRFGNKLLRFNTAETTGDTSAYDTGWEFNKDSIEFVEEYEELVPVKKYRPISATNESEGSKK